MGSRKHISHFLRFRAKNYRDIFNFSANKTMDETVGLGALEPKATLPKRNLLKGLFRENWH